MSTPPITSADVASLAERLADQRASAARADRQVVIDELERKLAAAAAEYAAHMATHRASLGPIELRDLDELLEAEPELPRDRSLYVPCPTGVSLEEAFMGLPSDNHLLLLQRDQEVPIDTADGFRAAGASAVAGTDGKRIPVASTFKGRSARTWFAMARARRGVVGLGPGSRAIPRASAFTQEQQIPDKGSPLPGGGTSPGRFWWNLKGEQKHELVGAQEKLIESVHDDAHFANFALEGMDFGGVAYSAISALGGRFSRLGLDGAWRGFAGEPNGETAAINIAKRAYLISRCATSPLNAAGRRVGSSPMMVNDSPGGRWEHGDSSQAIAGMPTIWRSSGLHEWIDVISRWGGPGVNLEQCLDGFEFRWTGGICWPNRGGAGGHPAPDGIHRNSLHVSLNARGRATVTLRDVDLDDNVQAGKLCVQLYGDTTDPSKVRVTATQGNRQVPVAAYGKGGVVALAS